MGDLSQQLAGLSDEQGRLLKGMEDISAELEKDGADREALKAQLGTMSADLAALTEARKREAEAAENVQIKADIEALKSASRTPSKAREIGMGPGPVVAGSSDLFFWSLWAAKNSQNPQFHAVGKANLEAMGSYWEDSDPRKATLGDSAGAGGNIVPPNVLGSLIEIQTALNPYRELLDVIDAGFVSGVDVPTEGLAPVRATVQAYGATKTNLNLTVAKYTATMYTLAAIDGSPSPVMA